MGSHKRLGVRCASKHGGRRTESGLLCMCPCLLKVGIGKVSSIWNCFLGLGVVVVRPTPSPALHPLSLCSFVVARWFIWDKPFAGKLERCSRDLSSWPTQFRQVLAHVSAGLQSPYRLQSILIIGQSSARTFEHPSAHNWPHFVRLAGVSHQTGRWWCQTVIFPPVLRQ